MRLFIHRFIAVNLPIRRFDDGVSTVVDPACRLPPFLLRSFRASAFQLIKRLRKPRGSTFMPTCNAQQSEKKGHLLVNLN